MYGLREKKEANEKEGQYKKLTQKSNLLESIKVKLQVCSNLLNGLKSISYG